MPNIRTLRSRSDRRSPVVLLLALLCGSLPAALMSQSGDWTQWRGTARDGVSPGEAWSASLDSGALREAWRADLGSSYSGVVLGSEALYVSERTTPGREAVTALDPTTGAPLWTVGWPVEHDMPRSAGHENWPKSTPAVVGDALFFLGIDEHLRSLNAATGELNWSIDFPTRFRTPRPEFGASTSPLAVGDSLYVQAAGSLFAIDQD